MAVFNQRQSVDKINKESDDKIMLHKDVSFTNKVQEKIEDPKDSNLRNLSTKDSSFKKPLEGTSNRNHNYSSPSKKPNKKNSINLNSTKLDSKEMKPYVEKPPSNMIDKPNIIKTNTIKDEDKKINKIT